MSCQVNPWTSKLFSPSHSIEGPSDKGKFPPEIATYLWLISLHVRVRFTNGKWYTSEVKGLREKRPIRDLMEYHIDAIDAKGTLIDYHGMAQISKYSLYPLCGHRSPPRGEINALNWYQSFTSTIFTIRIQTLQMYTCSCVKSISQ